MVDSHALHVDTKKENYYYIRIKAKFDVIIIIMRDNDKFYIEQLNIDES